MRIKRCIYITFREDDRTVLLFNLRTLYNIGQMTFCIGSTNATTDRTVLTQCVTYTITYHAVFTLLAFHRTQEVRQHLVRLFAVEVVGIDNRKGFFDQITTHQHSVIRTPWFGTLWVVGTACRHFVNRLEANLTLYFALVFG